MGEKSSILVIASNRLSSIVSVEVQHESPIAICVFVLLSTCIFFTIPTLAQEASPGISIFGDFDQDGIPDAVDTDDDGDGVPDVLDPVPFNGSRSTAGLKPEQLIRLNLANRQFSSPRLGTVGIDSRASAVSINVTSVFPEQDGYIAVWPCTGGLPSTSSVNYERFGIHSNNVIAPLSASGEVCFFSSQDSGVVVDITGFFSGEAFVGFQPQRIFDSRFQFSSEAPKPSGITEVDLSNVLFSNLATGTLETLAAYDAVFLNGVITDPAAAGYLTVWSCDTAQPGTSNINFEAGQTIANGLLVDLGPRKRLCLFNSAAANVILDFSGAVKGGYVSVEPARVLDSRSGLGGVPGRLVAGQGVSLPIWGQLVRVDGVTTSIPAFADAVALNLTAVESDSDGFVTAWPCGAARPATSSLNFVAGKTTANNAIVAVGGDGRVCLFSSGSTNLVVDLVGYFQASGDDQVVPVSPERIIDTRTNTGPAPSARQ